MSYAKKRYITYLIITIFCLVLPFITIDGNHMLLLSFVDMEFHFLGNAFDMQELYVMPFLLMILFIGIFAITSIGGRMWCGWACPQTIFRVIYRDLLESKLLNLRRIKNKQKDIDYDKGANSIKKVAAITIFTLLSTLISINFMWYFVPPEDFFAYMANPTEHMFMILFILTIVLFLVYDIVFTKEHFCTYVCPYSRIQSTLYDDDTKQVIYNTNRGGDIYQNGEKSIFNMKEWSANEECTTCEACVKICPTGIDIRKGLQVECINCLECVDACTSVMDKLGKKTLVQWGTTNEVLKDKETNVFSFKNNMYYASIALCFILALYFSAQKEFFLINVNKTTQLYRVTDENKARNNYIITLQNTQDKPYTYDIKLKDNINYEIKKFKPFKVDAKKRVKKILIIESKTNRRLSASKDVPLSIDIIIQAKENKEISTTKSISFTYPRNDRFNK